MALSKSAANKGQKTHESKPSSTLSKQAYVTKPEKRNGTSHKYSVAQAEKMVKNVHC